MTGLRVSHLMVDHAGPPRVRTIHDASFAVAPGEIVGLLGPSGSGKTTLLHALVGILRPASGSISFNDEDLTHTVTHRRGFGLVFQDGQLFPHRNVAGNVGFGLEVAHVDASARSKRVAEMLDLVGLSGFEHRSVGELSGGERQRVALARSLAPRPRLLLLDEPLSSLDAELRLRLAVDVRDVLRSTFTTAIVVTHDQVESELMCSRIVRIRDGKVSTARAEGHVRKDEAPPESS